VKLKPEELVNLQYIADRVLQDEPDPREAIHDLYALVWGALLRACRERPGGLCAGLGALWERVSDQQIAPASIAEALQIAEVDPLLLVLHSWVTVTDAHGSPSMPPEAQGEDPDKRGWSTLDYDRELIEEIGAPKALAARITHRAGPEIHRSCRHRGGYGLDLSGLPAEEAERIKRDIRIHPCSPTPYVSKVDPRLAYRSWSPLRNLERAGYPPVESFLAHARLLHYEWEMDNDIWLIEFNDGSREAITTDHGSLVPGDRAFLEEILAKTVASAREIQHFLQVWTEYPATH